MIYEPELSLYPPSLTPKKEPRQTGPSNHKCISVVNPAAFAIPARGTWGNAGRAIATGPGLVQVDFALQKNTRIAEGKDVVFRIETFNLFNRTQAGNSGTTFTSPASLGLVNSGLNRTIGTGTSRQMQLAMHLNF